MFNEQTSVENHIVSSVLLSRSARLARGNHVASYDSGIALGQSARVVEYFPCR